jgi:putative methyltransferase (TIGR04325 family)
MAHKAASAMATDELAFSSDVQEAAATLQRVDLLHTSGALQYLDNPRAHLTTLVSLGATHMLFNRLSLTQGAHDIITVQESWLSENGPGPMPSGIPERKVRYPFICLQASAFYDALSKDYNIVMTFDDRSGMLPIPGEPIIGVGLLARLKREHGTACPL